MEKIFGKKLREKRKSKGLLIRDLAARADISESYISRIECGYTTPLLTTVMCLAAALECDARELIPTKAEVLQENLQKTA